MVPDYAIFPHRGERNRFMINVECLDATPFLPPRAVALAKVDQISGFELVSIVMPPFPAPVAKIYMSNHGRASP